MGTHWIIKIVSIFITQIEYARWFEVVSIFLRKQDCIFPIFRVMHWATHHIEQRAIMNILGGRGCLNYGDTWKKKMELHICTAQGDRWCCHNASFTLASCLEERIATLFIRLSIISHSIINILCPVLPTKCLRPLFMRQCVIMPKVFLLSQVLLFHWPTTVMEERGICVDSVFSIIETLTRSWTNGIGNLCVKICFTVQSREQVTYWI